LDSLIPRTDRWEAFDKIERAIVENLPEAFHRTTHNFTPGLYIRTTFVQANALFTSQIHKTEHPFILASGIANVWVDGIGWQRIEAPYMGVTKAGTRRLIVGITETVCTTFHVTDKTDIDEIEADIYELRTAHLEGASHPRIDTITPAALAGAAGTESGV